MIPKSGNKNIDDVIMYGAIILLVVIVFKLLKFVISPIQSVKDELGIPSDSPNFDPSTLNPDYSKTNYPETQFKLWADTLEDSLWAVFGEDEQPIKDIMYQINNDEDFKAIVKAYGIRTSALGFEGGNLPSELRRLTPELVDGFNSHYAGWNMKYRI